MQCVAMHEIERINYELSADEILLISLYDISRITIWPFTFGYAILKWPENKSAKLSEINLIIGESQDSYVMQDESYVTLSHD